MITKVCRTCGVEKNRSEFPSTGWQTRKDGSKRLALKADCKTCHNAATMSKYYRALEELGVVFKCVRCGYDKCGASIDFHHADPSEKDFTIASRVSISKEKLSNELDKCVTLCKNCHGEYHAGVWQLTELEDY